MIIPEFLFAALALLLGSTAQSGPVSRPVPPGAECRSPADPTKDDAAARAARAEACKAVIQSNPANSEAHLIFAMTMLDDPVAMLEALEAGRRIAPNDYWLQLNTGFTLSRLDRYDEAIDAFQRAGAIRPTDAEAFTQAGLTAAEAGQHERAIYFLTQATNLPPHDGYAWGYLARSEAALGRHADAVRHWDRAERESGYRFLYRAGDADEYARSLAAAPEAHVPPSQFGATLRLFAPLAALLVFVSAAGVFSLRWRRERPPAPGIRLFLVIAVGHFVLSVALMVVTVGASYGAHRGWPAIPGQYALAFVWQLLVAPIILARAAVLPHAWAPGFGFGWLFLNSCLWAVLGAGLVRLLKRGHGAPSRS